MSQIKRQDPDNPVFKKYFMHGCGHPLGLDVHDVGITTEPMQAGWVMTVEPAIYVREEGFAVRLENDVLISEQGPIDLMEKVPIEPDHIEACMKSRPRAIHSGNGGGNGGNGAAKHRSRRHADSILTNRLATAMP